MARFCKLISVVIRPYITVEVRGGSGYHDVTPLVLAANHRSLADLWIGLVVFHELGLFPGILFSRRMLPGPLAKLAQAAGVILVDRGGATEAGIEALNRNRSLMVMPEGGLYFDADQPTRLGPIKPGMVRMARGAGRPIAPVAVSGTEVAWPKGKWPKFRPLRPHKVIVTLGPPAEIQLDDDQAEADRIMAGVETLLIDNPVVGS